MKNLALLGAALLGLAAAADVTSMIGKQQTIAIPNDAYKYTVKYNIQGANGPVDYWLSISGLDVSKWTIDKTAFVALVLGFGGSTTTNIDAVYCSISYKQDAQFKCVDTFFDADGNQKSSDADNLISYSTVKSDFAKGELEVKFTRAIETSTPDLDYVLDFSKKQSYSWAMITYEGTGVPSPRTGTFDLMLATGENTASSSFSVLANQAGLLLALFASLSLFFF